MGTDYAFFEKSLAERKSYRFWWDWKEGFPKPPEAESRFQVVREDEDNTIVTGRHVMRAGHPIGLAQVNERFNVTLPQDMDDFYRRWDGGFLFFRRCYFLLDVQEIIYQAELFRELRKEAEPPDLPWHLIRFCDMGNGDYLAMRLREDETDWEVIYASVEYADVTMLREREEHAGLVLDSSFRCWLKRMCKTDGWPIGGEYIEPEDAEPPGERIE